MSSKYKNISQLTLQNLIPEFKGILIDKKIHNSPRRVTDFHYCLSSTKVRNQPKLVGLSKSIVQNLGLNYEEVKQSEQSALYLSGSKQFSNSMVLCNNYCGFQFGSWAGQLGDGRAHTLGNVVQNKQIYELQLKGSGLSPFSRRADGNSVVSSALREFLASELMYGLKVPTTRAASLVIANQEVIRDPFYDGNIKVENSAIVLRVCQSFLRFGSLQVCAEGGNMLKKTPLQNRNILLPLLDYLLKYCYSEIDSEQGDPYEKMFQIIVKRTAQLVAYWQSVGFVHGVLNTDNMSMVNKTIDYGPFAFIDYFSEDFISNQTDQHERYSYRRQPEVIKWNLKRLAEAMDYIIPKDILLKHLNQNFDKSYQEQYHKLMCEKLGLNMENKDSHKIIANLFKVMHICSTHFTNTFRILQKNFVQGKQIEKQTVIKQLLEESCPLQYYLKNIRASPRLLGISCQEIYKQDDGFNLFFIKEQKERFDMIQLLKEETAQKRKQRQYSLWSQWIDLYVQSHPTIKKNSCPKYVLLNETAKLINAQLIKIQSSKDQLEYVEKILKVFQDPFQSNEWFQETLWKHKPIPVKLTCSS